MNDRRKFRSQTSDLWTDAATVVGRVREERARSPKINMREKEEHHKALCFSNVLWLPKVEKYAGYSGRCGAIWRKEVKNCSGAKRMSKSKC